MALRLYQVVIPVSEIEEAKTFYAQLLGSPGRRVSLGRHHFDSHHMVVSCVSCYDAQAERRPPSQSSLPQQVFFVSDDLDADFERARRLNCLAEEEIATTPWGDRSFLVKDPFGNSIGFLDESTMQRRVGERWIGGPEDRLRAGLAISIHSTRAQYKGGFVASVERIFENEIWLSLSKPPEDVVFQEGETVRVQYWDMEGAFYSETKVTKIAPDQVHLGIAVPEHAKPRQRRAAPRVNFRLPVSFSVFEGPDSTRLREGVMETHSVNISTGGIRFESESPLDTGDRLHLTLTMSESQKVGVVAKAKVVASERVTSGGMERFSVGAQFIEMSLDDQIKLLQFLIAHEEKGAEESAADETRADPPQGEPPAPQEASEEEEKPAC